MVHKLKSMIDKENSAQKIHSLFIPPPKKNKNFDRLEDWIITARKGSDQFGSS